MRSRYLAAAAAVWAAAYAGVYLVIVRNQGNPVAWWYLILVAAGAAALALSAAGRWSRPMLIFGAAVLAVAALAGVLSIGALLLPGVACAAAAAAGPSWRSRTSGPSA